MNEERRFMGYSGKRKLKMKKKPDQRSQTSLEYVFLVGGALVFVVIVFLALRGGAFSTGGNRVANQAGNFLNVYGKSYLLYENFDDGDTNVFTPVGTCTWQVQNAEYVKTSGALCSSLSEVFATNFSYSTRTRYVGGVKSMGLTFRAQNSTHYYAAYFSSAGWFYLVKYNPASTVLDSLPFSIPVNTPFTLRVDAYGNNFSYYFNSNYLGSLIDDTFSNGTFGLYGYGFPLYFDDVKACETAPC